MANPLRQYLQRRSLSRLPRADAKEVIRSRDVLILIESRESPSFKQMDDISRWLRKHGLEPYFILWSPKEPEGTPPPSDTFVLDKKSLDWLQVPKVEIVQRLKARTYGYVFAMHLPQDHPLHLVAVALRAALKVCIGSGEPLPAYSLFFVPKEEALPADQLFDRLFAYLGKIKI